MKSVCFRIDIRTSPWSEYSACKESDGEPSYVVKLLLKARKLGIRLHFFIVESAIAAYPSMADVIVGEGHALDPLLDTGSTPADKVQLELYRQLKITCTALQKNDINWDGAAIDGDNIAVEHLIGLREYFSWTALRAWGDMPSVAPSSVMPIIFCSGPIDKHFIQNENSGEKENAGSFIAHIKERLNADNDLSVITLHPQLLACIDPMCSVLRAASAECEAVGRRIVTLREWAGLMEL